MKDSNVICLAVNGPFVCSLPSGHVQDHQSIHGGGRGLVGWPNELPVLDSDAPAVSQKPREYGVPGDSPATADDYVIFANEGAENAFHRAGSERIEL